jgi:hypothetical protein
MRMRRSHFSARCRATTAILRFASSAAAAPRLTAVARTGQQREHHGIVHQRQAGIVADEYLFGWRTHDGRE